MADNSEGAAYDQATETSGQDDRMKEPAEKELEKESKKEEQEEHEEEDKKPAESSYCDDESEDQNLANKKKRSFMRKAFIAAGVGTAATVVGILAAPVIASAALGAAGFGASGVVAGSAAAVVQSAIGNVAAGSLFAACQSAGATGVIGSAATAAIGGGTGLSGLGATLGALKLFGKSPDTTKLLICGSGAGAHALAGIASAKEGLNVRVLSLDEDEAEKWNAAIHEKKLEVTFQCQTKESTRISSKPALITKNPKDAMQDVDVVVFVLPASAHQLYLETLKPCIKPGTVIVGLPGYPGFVFQAHHLLDVTGRQCTLIHFESLPWECHITEFGTRCEVFGIKGSLIGAIKEGDVPPRKDPVPTLQCLLGPIPKLIVSGHPLAVDLMSVNAYLHTSIMYGQWEGWDGIPLGQRPPFYNGLTEPTAILISSISEEIKEIAKLLELKTGADMSQVVHIYDWYLRCYSEEISDKTDLYTVIKTNAVYQGLKHPVKKTADGKFLPDYTSRYMTEDIPYGLAVIRGIAEIVGLETPNIDEVLSWSQRQMDKEYLINSKLQGKDILTSRVPQRYGFNTLESIL